MFSMVVFDRLPLFPLYMSSVSLWGFAESGAGTRFAGIFDLSLYNMINLKYLNFVFNVQRLGQFFALQKGRRFWAFVVYDDLEA